MPQAREIPPDLPAEMTPAVRAFVSQLLTRLSSLEARLETSEKRLEASERRVAELEKENRELRLGWV